MTIIGVDAGGTFTDFIMASGGRARSIKIASSPDDPARAVLIGIRSLARQGPGTRPDVVVHGSTVATNVLLERRGARTALLVTAGFEDLLEIGRQARPDLYALDVEKPPPLVPRSRCFGVSERLDARGEVSIPLDEAQARALGQRLSDEAVESVAVVFLHSYLQSDHEERVGAALAGLKGPSGRDVHCSLSSHVVAELREVERASTTVVDAYVAPVVSDYLTSLEEGLEETKLRVMQSSGASMSASMARSRPVNTILSGPAAGVIGAVAAVQPLGETRFITFDMGGTSTDVSLCHGRPSMTTETVVAGHPVKVPAIDVHTVGAGGGSVAWLDAGGALRVGPQSAGADPGPACYGRGGRAPTVTDASLVLGRLSAHAPLADGLELDLGAAREALAPLASLAQLGIEEAAEGICAIANSAMARAIRVISVRRGYDPRELTLVAFGGAGPGHACDLAREFGIRRVIVPWQAGLLSARGLVTAETAMEYSQTVLGVSEAGLELAFMRLEGQARDEMRAQGMELEETVVMRQIDARYEGQSFELTVAYDGPDRWARAFVAAHSRHHGFALPLCRVEPVTARIRAVSMGSEVATGPSSIEVAPMAPTTAHMWLDGRRCPVPLWRLEAVEPGRPVSGPALICEMSTTVAVLPGFVAHSDHLGNLTLEPGQ